MTTEQQIILQTFGDLWMLLALVIIIGSTIQAVKEFKGFK